MCMPAHEARRILYAENKKCDEKLRGKVVLSSTARRSLSWIILSLSSGVAAPWTVRWSLSKCAESGKNRGYLFFNDQPKGLICHWSQYWCLSFTILIAAQWLLKVELQKLKKQNSQRLKKQSKTNGYICNGYFMRVKR